MDHERRARVGQAIMASGVVLLVLAILFWWDVIPIDPEAKTLVTGIVLLAAIGDFAIGWFLGRR